MESHAPLRIAFTGKMATGKSLAASMVQEMHPGTEVLSLGSPIKDIARNTFGMTTKDRRLLQIIGNTGRALGPLTWVNLLLAKVKAGKPYVVDDVRFEDEANALRKHGFTVVKLTATRDTRIDRIRSLYGEHAEEHLRRMDDVSEDGAVTADWAWTSDTLEGLRSTVNALSPYYNS